MKRLSDRPFEHLTDADLYLKAEALAVTGECLPGWRWRRLRRCRELQVEVAVEIHFRDVRRAMMAEMYGTRLEVNCGDVRVSRRVRGRKPDILIIDEAATTMGQINGHLRSALEER